jgi:hypothetical protein
VRNRVAHSDVQPLRALLARAAVLIILPTTLLAAAATAASAAPLAAAEADARIPFGIAGPVGIVAVAIGLLGVVAGLVRHRRRRAHLARAIPQPTAVTPEPVAPSHIS